MKTCTYCGHENDEVAGNCTDCGSLLESAEGEQEIEHYQAMAEKESQLARKFLTIRDARKHGLRS